MKLTNEQTGDGAGLSVLAAEKTTPAWRSVLWLAWPVFVEAVTLLTSLGASRIAVQQEEGENRKIKSVSARRHPTVLKTKIRLSGKSLGEGAMRMMPMLPMLRIKTLEEPRDWGTAKNDAGLCR